MAVHHEKDTSLGYSADIGHHSFAVGILEAHHYSQDCVTVQADTVGLEMPWKGLGTLAEEHRNHFEWWRTDRYIEDCRNTVPPSCPGSYADWKLALEQRQALVDTRHNHNSAARPAVRLSMEHWQLAQLGSKTSLSYW